MTTLPHAPIATLRQLAAPLRLRVTRDAEGWPLIPGRLGAIEWHDGRALAVFTARPRLLARLWAVPGVRRHQVGDQEARGLFPPEALPAVATLIRARRRRPAGSAAHLQRPAGPPYRVTSAA